MAIKNLFPIYSTEIYFLSFFILNVKVNFYRPIFNSWQTLMILTSM